MKQERKIGRGLWYALAFSIASLYFIFKGLAGIGAAPDFHGVNWPLVLVGFVVQTVVWWAKATRMYFIALGMDAKVPLFRFFQIYLATCFISHVTPFSSGGTPLQIYLLNREGLTLGKATALTTVDLGLNTAMFLLLIPLALIAKFKLTGTWLLWVDGAGWKWDALAVGLILAVLVAVIIFKGWRRFDWSHRVRSYLLRKGWLKRLYNEWSRFKEGWLLIFRKNPRSLWGAVLATVAYWLFYLLLAPIIIWALGRPASFLKLISYQLIFNFAQILVPTPGGSGGSELILTYLFRGVTGLKKIGLFVLLWKGYTFFSSLLFGGICFWILLYRSSRLFKSGSEEKR